jgi:hypothetical protein
MTPGITGRVSRSKSHTPDRVLPTVALRPLIRARIQDNVSLERVTYKEEAKVKTMVSGCAERLPGPDSTLDLHPLSRRYGTIPTHL